MDRAQKFITEAREEILMLMGKGLRNLHPKEMDMIVALCDMHEGACEFLELEEKFDGKGYGGMFGDNPRHRR